MKRGLGKAKPANVSRRAELPARTVGHVHGPVMTAFGADVPVTSPRPDALHVRAGRQASHGSSYAVNSSFQHQI
jgi:hypothetical protein